ncbi:hypothetical protein [Aliikangiella sp. IMCC44359]
MRLLEEREDTRLRSRAVLVNPIDAHFKN